MGAGMRHALIVCHPCEESFVMAMARRYAEAVRAHGHEVVLRDLYRLGFDPVLRDEERTGQFGADVEAELAALEGSEVFVLVYPVWYGGPPAMLKGYIDRVLGAGRVFGLVAEDRRPSLLEGKRLVTLSSSGRMRAFLEERGVLGALRNHFDRYLVEVFGLDGAETYHFDGLDAGAANWEIGIHLGEVEMAARKVMSRYAFRRRSVRS